jgi:hypothetical protein
LCAEYVGRWLVTRLPCGAPDAAREPGRAYHFQAGDGTALAECVGTADRRGSLI